MSQKNLISRPLIASIAKKCIWVTLVIGSSAFAQGPAATSVTASQTGAPAKLTDSKPAEVKQIEKAQNEKTLRDFGKMDLEILYLEKAKKIEELKFPKTGAAVATNTPAVAEQKPLVSLAPSQSNTLAAKVVVKKKKSDKTAPGAEVVASAPIPRPTFKLKSMFGTGGNLTAVLSTGENSVASVKKGQMINGWTLERFLENGVVVSNGEHQAILVMTHEKVPSGSASSSATADASGGGNQLSARQLPNPRIDR